MNYTMRWTQPYTLWAEWKPLETDIEDLSEARAVLARIMSL